MSSSSTHFAAMGGGDVVDNTLLAEHRDTEFHGGASLLPDSQSPSLPQTFSLTRFATYLRRHPAISSLLVCFVTLCIIGLTVVIDESDICRDPNTDQIVECLLVGTQRFKKQGNLAQEHLCNSRWGDANVRERLDIPKHRYFVALNLHNNEQVIPHLLVQLIKLIKLIGVDNVFVSIFESGSDDMSSVWMHVLQPLLDLHSVKNTLVSTHLSRSEPQNRIGYLARVRNIVMQPLYDGRAQADRIIFLNDVFFCPEDVVRLAQRVEFGHNVDMACGLDLVASPRSHTLFYDNWVARDMDGTTLTNRYPFFQREWDMDRLSQGLAVPVYHCWNGLVVMKARPITEQGVRFRSAGSDECAGSECALFCKDLWNVGFGNLLVDPAVTVFYDQYAFERAHYFPQSGVGDVSVPLLSSFPNIEERTRAPKATIGGMLASYARMRGFASSSRPQHQGGVDSGPPIDYFCQPLLHVQAQKSPQHTFFERSNFEPPLFDTLIRSSTQE